MNRHASTPGGTIACPECAHPISVHWQLLLSGVNPHCDHCGLTLALDRGSSTEALAAAARLNEAMNNAEQRRQAILPSGKKDVSA